MSNSRRKAAEWLLKLENPDVSAAELLRWEAWLKQSARHRQAFLEIEHFSRRMIRYRAELKEIPIPSVSEGDVQEGVKEDLAGGGNAGQVGASLRSAWNRLPLSPIGIRRALFATIFSAGLASLAYVLSSNIPNPAEEAAMRSYQTAVSEHRSVVLPDGSAIEMGGKSSLSVNFSARQRVVMLESGEALFQVAEEEKRPFVVIAGAGTITALSTVFNVRRDADRVVVTVTEGRVEVKRTPQGSAGSSQSGASGRQPTITTIGVGDQAIVSGKGLSVVEFNDPATITEWQTGHLQYLAEPLRYVVTGVSRYSAREFIIVDPEIGDLLFTGSVYQDQTDDWLEALETVFPLDVTHAGENKVLIRKRQSGSVD